MPRKRRQNNSRPARWQRAVARARDAADVISDQLEALNSARQDLEDLRAEYEEWRDNLPENMQASPLGEKLDAVADLELSEEVELDVDWLDEVENIELPLGFGRD